MDGSRFDQIARGIAAGSSRRTLLKSLGGGVLAALGLARAGGGVDADDTCKPAAPKPQSKCNKDAQCCAGLVCQATGDTTTKRCQSGCRIDGTFFASGAINPANPCQSCQPGTSTTAWSNKDCSPFACDPVTGACFTSCESDAACASGVHCVFDESGFNRVCCSGDDYCVLWDICCDPDRSPTADCCPAGGCCECFKNSDPGGLPYICCEQENLCGPAGADTCCHLDEDCVNGRCCHQTFHCEDRCCDRPCCGDVCCAQGTECVNGTCVPQDRACNPDAAENPNCLAGEICASFDNVCCTPDRIVEHTFDIDGVPTVLTECCSYGSGPSHAGGSSEECCSAPDYCTTSRGTRIRP